MSYSANGQHHRAAWVDPRPAASHLFDPEPGDLFAPCNAKLIEPQLADVCAIKVETVNGSGVEFKNGADHRSPDDFHCTGRRTPA